MSTTTTTTEPAGAPPAAAPPGAPPAPAGGTSPPASPPGDPATTPPAPPKAGDPPAAGDPARPAWLPEKFKSPEDLAKSYGELESAFGRKAEAAKAELLAELRQGVPEKPEGYALTVPDGLLPEGFAATVDDKDPFLGEMRGLMHELGAKPEQFEKAAHAFLKWQVANMPDVAAERAKLGEGAPERIATVDRWLAANLGQDEYGAVAAGLVTATGIQALEKIMRMATGTGPRSVPGGQGGESFTPEQAAAALANPAYRQDNPEGAALRAKFAAFTAGGGRLPGYGSGGFSR